MRSGSGKGQQRPDDADKGNLLPDAIPLSHARVPVVVFVAVSTYATISEEQRHAPKLRFGSHPHFPRAHAPSPLGQCVYGLCSYPISSKKWIFSLFWKSAAAMLCTGASPQRCQWRFRVSTVMDSD